MLEEEEEEGEEDTVQRFREPTNRVVRADDRAICFQPKIQGRSEDGKSRSVLDDPWKSGHKRSVRSQTFETNLILGSVVSLRMARLSLRSPFVSSRDQVAVENEEEKKEEDLEEETKKRRPSIHPSVRPSVVERSLYHGFMGKSASSQFFKFSRRVL